MRSLVLVSCLLAPIADAQQRRVPFEFDAGLGLQPARTQQKVTALEGKLPAVRDHRARAVRGRHLRWARRWARQQSTCLATRSRVRPLLPVPSLTDEEREFVAYWLGGVFWRMRGGGLLQLGSTRSDSSDEQVTPGASRFAGCCR